MVDSLSPPRMLRVLLPIFVSCNANTNDNPPNTDANMMGGTKYNSLPKNVSELNTDDITIPNTTPMLPPDTHDRNMSLPAIAEDDDDDDAADAVPYTSLFTNGTSSSTLRNASSISRITASTSSVPASLPDKDADDDDDTDVSSPLDPKDNCNKLLLRLLFINEESF